MFSFVVCVSLHRLQWFVFNVWELFSVKIIRECIRRWFANGHCLFLENKYQKEAIGKLPPYTHIPLKEVILLSWWFSNIKFIQNKSLQFCSEHLRCSKQGRSKLRKIRGGASKLSKTPWGSGGIFSRENCELQTFWNAIYLILEIL